ncbi:hypothetical protein Tsubulata_034707 [Turnera subulata]|uniref:Uncharacterized protein n=1 Tax=Turnera subulata TaxID=218843 RepID=A0A9Q0JJZ2_9ROSI|nr:hypothetical protein Tsubulata_034707 [Turnera subulata]
MRKSAATMTTTATTPCCSKVGLKRGPWAPEEDEILSNFIKKEGTGRWRTLPKRAGLRRCGKSCRLRWMNYLRPSVKRGQIAPDEEDLILRLHRLLGNRWSLIAGRIPGRTDNEIKNYWNTHLSKKLISQGIDPRTHKPLQNHQPVVDRDHHHHALLLKPSSSSKDVPQATPTFDPPVITGSDEPTHHFIGNKGNQQYCFQSTCLDQEYGQYSANANHGYSSFLNCGGSGMDQRDDYMGLEDEEGHGDLIIGKSIPEDALSLFLNSLINDDAFITQNDQMHQQESTAAGMESIPDPSISFPATSNHDADNNLWDGALLPSALGENDPKGVHVE